jgi:hypothetical protein
LPAKRGADQRIAGLDIFPIEALKFRKSLSDNPATLSEPQGAGSVVRLAGRGASSDFRKLRGQRSLASGGAGRTTRGGRPAGNQAAEVRGIGCDAGAVPEIFN